MSRLTDSWIPAGPTYLAAEAKGDLKEGVPMGPGQRRPSRGARDGANRARSRGAVPLGAHASNSLTGVQGSGRSHLFNEVLKLVSKQQERDYSTSPHNSGRVSKVQVCSSLTLVCWEDAGRI